ncbi:MAG: hypothetical protein AB7S26_17185 [Sandaracinaceae bacterium]
MRSTLASTLVLTVALGALAIGCRRRDAPTQDARRVERYERSLIRLASRDSRCSPVEVQPVRIAEDVWTANTCAGPFDYHLYCRSRGRRWANCSWHRIPRVEEAAQNVLMCPMTAVLQEPTAQPLVRFANGCGRRVQMNLACNQVGCGWLAAGPPTGPPASQTNATVVVVPAPPE